MKYGKCKIKNQKIKTERRYTFLNRAVLRGSEFSEEVMTVHIITCPVKH